MGAAALTPSPGGSGKLAGAVHGGMVPAIGTGDAFGVFRVCVQHGLYVCHCSLFPGKNSRG